jgi:hypothetical protein
MGAPHRRLRRCIQSFDLDPTLPNDNLEEEVQLYPEIASKMQRINRHSWRLAVVITLALALNFILSAVHTLRDYSEGKSSAMALLSYTLLLAPRVLGWLLNAYRAYFRNEPVSFFIKTPALPNTIDADWKYRPEVYRPRYSAAAATLGGTRTAAAPAKHGIEEHVELLVASA